MDNKKVLDEGFAKGLRQIEQVIMTSLHWAAVELVHSALVNRGYTGFTGNTETSYMCGIYLNGSLREVVDMSSELPSPVRRKIRNGQYVYLDRPYEGTSRGRHGYVDVNSEYGSETSLRFLGSYKAPRRGVALVMTTGTEYSEFLEEMFNLDVLTRTFLDAPRIISSNWRSVRD